MWATLIFELLVCLILCRCYTKFILDDSKWAWLKCSAGRIPPAGFRLPTAVLSYDKTFQKPKWQKDYIVTRFLAQTIEHNRPGIKLEKIKLTITLFTYAASLNIDPILQKLLRIDLNRHLVWRCDARRWTKVVFPDPAIPRMMTQVGFRVSFPAGINCSMFDFEVWNWRKKGWSSLVLYT